MQPKKGKWNKVLRWLPGLLISTIAIYAVFKFVDLDDLRTAFATVKIGFIFLILAIDILGLIARGRTWQVILGSQVSFKQAFFGICEGYFLNNVLPFRAGELGRSYFVGRSTGKGTFYVLSTIVIERAFDIVFAAGLVVITLPFLIGMDWVKPIAFAALILVVTVFILLFLLARNREKVLCWIDKVKKPSRFWNFIFPKIQNIIDGFSLLAKPSQFFLSLLWIGICWLIWTTVYYAAVVAIIPGSPLWWGAFVSGILALGVAIPSAPSALGVYEATFVGALAILGGASGTALAYAIILHLIQFVVSAAFGIWGLIREGLSFSQMFSSFDTQKIDSDSTDKSKEGV
jgi:glycosyltransferase 2 family protein